MFDGDFMSKNRAMFGTQEGASYCNILIFLLRSRNSAHNHGSDCV